MEGVEKQIREAYERGEFDNLPGSGKPLRLRHLDDPEWFAKQLMERRVREALLRDTKVLVGGVNVEEYVEAWRARRFAR